MLKNLAFTMLTAVYYSVIPVYCFMQLFSCTDKFKIQNLYSRFSILLYSVGASFYQVV